MTLHVTLALIYSAACVGVIGFQFALMFGAPWGHVTQGGMYDGKLPLTGRVAAGASVFILLAMACAVLSAAGLWPRWPTWTGWATLALQALIAFANWITPSRPERLIWGPITSIKLLLVGAVVVPA